MENYTQTDTPDRRRVFNDSKIQSDITSKAKEVTAEIGPVMAREIYDDVFHACLSRGGAGRPDVGEAHREAVKALATVPERYAAIGIK